ncbi:protein ABHD17B [Silurus meridionalis]|nr:protein ABHD17B [Silurus meridionalis]
MNHLSLSELCCLFCCPPCPSRIASKLAFLPPEPTYTLLSDESGTRWTLHLSERADWQYSAREKDSIECFMTRTVRGNRIACMFVRCSPSARYTLLFSHGNAVDLGQMSSFYVGLGSRINCNVFSYDYSGYGASSGKPSEKNLYADVEAAWHALRTRGPADKHAQAINSETADGCCVQFQFILNEEEEIFNEISRRENIKTIQQLVHDDPFGDFALFPKRKILLNGHHFDTIAEIQCQLQKLLDTVRKLSGHIPLCKDTTFLMGHKITQFKNPIKQTETLAKCINRDNWYGIRPENVIVYGQSIGTVPSVDLAARYESAAVILHSPLTSGMRVAFPDTKKTYCFDAFPNIDKISKVTSPVLVIHGTEDEVIDFSHGLALYERCQKPVEPLWVDGAGHNDVELYGQYLERLKRFVSHELVNL